MDYPVHLANHLQQLLKSLRKSRKITQSDLARQLGVVQSRVADIERDPGAVSVEQLLQVLAMLGAHMVVREVAPEASATESSIEPVHTQAKATAAATLTARSKPGVQQPGTPLSCPLDDEPRGEW